MPSPFVSHSASAASALERAGPARAIRNTKGASRRITLKLTQPAYRWLRPSSIFHQVVDHRRIGQGRGVAQAPELVLGDLAQDAAHDLARAGLGQAWGP